jgi:aryl-alcohol dehydrogenase-like predicted oxidoreductase
MSEKIASLSRYHALGRSGLAVSPLCLGTMTFGNEEGWGASEATARDLFTRYLEAGGNFVDTADLYTGGDSESYLGRFMKDLGNRDRLVLATKGTFSQRPEDPNGGGNSRKHLTEACEASLRRLQTDYIDLYWVHVWDLVTPVEELMATLDALVTSGKVRYLGLSNFPAWYVGAAQMHARERGMSPIIALQYEYSLVERAIEFEFVPAAHELGLGVCPWSPLASGLLTGKYTREDHPAEGRLEQLKDSGNPVFEKFSERNWRIVDALLDVARDAGRSPAQVALNWVTRRPGVASTIVGATKPDQLDDNLQALEFDLPDEARARLDEASLPDRSYPYVFHADPIQGMVHGEHPVAREPAWYR